MQKTIDSAVQYLIEQGPSFFFPIGSTREESEAMAKEQYIRWANSLLLPLLSATRGGATGDSISATMGDNASGVTVGKDISQ